MFCQQTKILSRCGGCFLRENVPKATVYNDSMVEKAARKPRRKIYPVSKDPELTDASQYMAMIGKVHHRRDWLEDFRRLEWAPTGLNRWWEQKKQDQELMMEIAVDERHRLLGSDLAAAFYIVTRGGKARFRGNDEWYCMQSGPKLPFKYDPKLILQELDCSGMQLHYEGIENLQNLSRLRWISFNGNKNLDDFCLDRIGSELPSLQFLDISNCPKVSERGVEALYKMRNLRQLLVTNYKNSTEFELTCLMLEDCIPRLNCEMLLLDAPEESNPKLITEGEKVAQL